MFSKFKILLLFTLVSIGSFGQFYNGLQMSFGKSRVQYNDFYWSFYRYDNFDVYFNQNGKYLADYTAGYVKTKLPEIEVLLDYRLDKRIIFIVFNKLTDLRQTNVGLVSNQNESNQGGMTTIIKNKVFLYFNGNHEIFKQQINAAIAQVILNELLYGNDLKENVTNSTLINLPDWYLSGLISYISKDWSFEIENRVKDGILNKRYKKFYHLQSDDALIAGHSFWKYIADTYGKAIIPEILYLTRIYKNVNQGFMYSTGMKIKELSRDWMAYYTTYYGQDEQVYQEIDIKPVIKRPRKNRTYRQIKINSPRNQIAYVTNKSGRYTIWLNDLTSGKKKRILTKEHSIEQIVDYTFPVLSWHPSGRILTFITEEKGGLKLYYYDLDSKNLESRNFLYFEKVLDYSFSDDGFRFVMSAVRNSQTDIFVYTLASAGSEQITNDIADDLTPRFINKSTSIIFSSDRLNDSLKVDINNTHKTDVVYSLYIYDYSNRSNTLKKLNLPEYTNNYNPFEIDHNKYVFVSDYNGILNKHVAIFDSVISYIDTAIHYRYITESGPVSNYSRSLEDFNYKNGNSGEVMFKKGRDYMFFKPNENFNTNFEINLKKTDYRKKYTKQLRMQDSINRINIQLIGIDKIKNNKLIIAPGDTVILNNWDLDINNYIFEREKINFYNQKLLNRNICIVEDTLINKKPRIRIYETAFYTNYLVNQVDFGFTNTSYQVFTGGAVFFSPGFNLLFKVGTNDLFEDYRITFGYRFSGDFESNEYVLSFENLKRRLDKQYIYHRQAFKGITNDNRVYRVQTNEGLYVLRYPLNQVFALQGTGRLRYDHGISMATDDRTLQDTAAFDFWTSAKLELIFDNTRSLGMNLYSGTRWKIFAESYLQLDERRSDLYVIGMDYRYYVPVHRSLIWAFRFAASSSVGHKKLIYYLGSVDNWYNLSSRVPTYDQTVPINNRENYAFQTLATNMRGFSQNIRNGNNFGLINTEIRWPVIRYLANRPLASGFLNNFQLVGFFDVGSAWQGLTPYSGKNAYDKTTKENASVVITIDSNREPIVAGYGYGLRTVLLGYFLRFDFAWGLENKTVLPRVFYFSLNLDF